MNKNSHLFSSQNDLLNDLMIGSKFQCLEKMVGALRLKLSSSDRKFIACLRGMFGSLYDEIIWDMQYGLERCYARNHV